MQQTKWTDRKFSFDFPAGLLPCIVERLRGTPARVEELIRSLPADILTIRVNGGWSIQEHAGHLWDLEELHYGRLDDYEAGVEILRAADLKNQKTFEADHNAKLLRHILESFRKGRISFVRRLESFEDAFLARSALHPRLQQPMRVVDFAFFVAEHDDHHLAKMTGLGKQLSQPRN